MIQLASFVIFLWWKKSFVFLSFFVCVIVWIAVRPGAGDVNEKRTRNNNSTEEICFFFFLHWIHLSFRANHFRSFHLFRYLLMLVACGYQFLLIIRPVAFSSFFSLKQMLKKIMNKLCLWPRIKWILFHIRNSFVCTMYNV